MPTAAAGLKVNAFAAGLKHPRWIEVLPNGDVLVAEALSEPGGIKSAFDYVMFTTMKRARAVGASPNRISLCVMRTATAWPKYAPYFSTGSIQPFRHVVAGRYLILSANGRVVAFPMKRATPASRDEGESWQDFEGAGTGPRSLLPVAMDESSSSASGRSAT